MNALAQAWRFGVVGTLGYGVDAGTLRVVISLLGLDVYTGRVVSFLTAATFTYLANRVWTFRAQAQGRAHTQLPLWLALMAGSMAINLGAYALCLELHPIFRDLPELAVAVGSLTAMGLNFLSARYIVFKVKP